MFWRAGAPMANTFQDIHPDYFLKTLVDELGSGKIALAVHQYQAKDDRQVI
jgi:hypothetical protein